MKRIAIFLLLLPALAVSCTIRKDSIGTPRQDDVTFFASFEGTDDDGTKVYADEDLYLRWNADDRVSIFNKLTYNQQYRFTGETGANAGGFRKVDSDEFVTGVGLSHVVSVYPFQESTRISEDEVLSLTLPAEQHFSYWGHFCPGTNTMVAVSSDNFLIYKNICGFLRISLYGENAIVSSITLKGNNGERLAGKATVTMSDDGVPSLTMANDASDTITLICDDAVWLPSNAEWSMDFWFVVPPTLFSKGFTVTVNQATSGVFEKTTANSITIERGCLSKMSPIEVDAVYHPEGVIYYTSASEQGVYPSNLDAFGANFVFSTYDGEKGILAFDGPVTCIGDSAFMSCWDLASIEIPDSVTSIGDHAFEGCRYLTSIEIPDSVTSIGDHAFEGCRYLTSIEIPDSVTSIGYRAFAECAGLTSIRIPSSVISMGVSENETGDQSNPFWGCSNLSSIIVDPGNPVFDSRDNCNAIIKSDTNELISGSLNAIIPNSVTSIGNGAFGGMSGLTSIEIPNSVTSIGCQSFDSSGLTSIEIPNSVTSIGNLAFSYCKGLTSIEIPDSVTSIGSQAFMSCSSLTSIEISNSVTSIGAWTFEGCSGLMTVTLLATTPPSLEGSAGFAYGKDYPIIYVPAESLDAYKVAQGWHEYYLRIHAIPTPSVPVPDAIDLGLSVKWASFNVGASSPEEYGNYYAWGEISTKSSYGSFLGYEWCNGTRNWLKKYNTNSNYGPVDNRTSLILTDDAARENLGGGWRMPSAGEIDELISNCSWTWTTQNDITGYRVTGPNGNSIFLPAAGRYGDNGKYLSNSRTNGYYWSSSLRADAPHNAYAILFTSGSFYRNSHTRTYGLPIRPVLD